MHIMCIVYTYVDVDVPKNIKHKPLYVITSIRTKMDCTLHIAIFFLNQYTKFMYNSETKQQNIEIICILVCIANNA